MQKSNMSPHLGQVKIKCFQPQTAQWYFSSAVSSLGIEVGGKRSVSYGTWPFHIFESGSTKCLWNSTHVMALLWALMLEELYPSSQDSYCRETLQVWVGWKRHRIHPDYPRQSPKGCLEAWISCLCRQQAWRKVPCLNTPGGLAIPSPQGSQAFPCVPGKFGCQRAGKPLCAELALKPEWCPSCFP